MPEAILPSVEKSLAHVRRNIPTACSTGTTFVITSIAIKTNQETRLDGVVTGRLTLRDVTRSITVPVAARLEGQTLKLDRLFRTQFDVDVPSDTYDLQRLRQGR